MNLVQQFFDSPATEKLGLCLLHSLWQIALIGLALKITLDLLGHRSSNARYNSSVIALLLALACPVLTWMVVETPQKNRVEKTVMETPLQDTDFNVQQNSYLNSSSASFITADTVNDPTADSEIASAIGTRPVPLNIMQSPSPWTSWIVCGWLAGILFFSVRPLIGYSTARRLLRQDRSPVPHWVQESITRLVRQLGIKRTVLVSHSRLVNVPTLVGLFRPVILLPLSSLTNLSTSELEAILLHELAHVRRFDQVANLLQALIETLLFFHPVVWWISGIARAERENCCDDIAVTSCRDSNSLVRALVTLEEKRNTRYGLGAMSSNGGSLLSRIKRLADPGARPGRSAVSLLSTIAVLAVTLALTAALTFNSVNAEQPGSIKLEDLKELRVNSVSSLYQWDKHSVTDPRLIHRFWNMFPPEQRHRQGESVENWTPDLEFEFTLASDESGKPGTVTVQVGLQDGFRWSVGNGVWPMHSQWPMRYSLNSLIRQSRDENAARQQDAAKEKTETRREKLFNDQTYHREKESLVEEHAGRWVAIVDGRVLASYDTFEDCLAAADEANRHASHRYIYRPGVDDQPQEFAHSPWITGQPNWWQIGIQFRREHMVSTAFDRWVVGDKTLRTDASGRGNVVLTSPDGNPLQDEKKEISHAAVCSGMVTQQLTIIANDVDQLRLDRFAVPGEVRSLTWQVACSKVRVTISIAELGIQQHVVAFVVPQAIVDLDLPDDYQQEFTPPPLRIDSSLDEHRLNEVREPTRSGAKENPLDNDRASELVDLLRNVDVKLNRRLQEATDEYDKIRAARNSVTGAESSDSGLTHLQINVRDLDAQLTKLRRDLTLARQQQVYVKNVLKKGGPFELMVWILEQEGLLKPQRDQSIDKANLKSLLQKVSELEMQKIELSQTYGKNHPDILSIERQIALWKKYINDEISGAQKQVILQPKEIIQRYEKMLSRNISQLEARVLAASENFKSHFELAKRWEQLDSDLLRKQKEIEMIKSWLKKAGQNILELDINEQTTESTAIDPGKQDLDRFKKGEMAALLDDLLQDHLKINPPDRMTIRPPLRNTSEYKIPPKELPKLLIKSIKKELENGNVEPDRRTSLQSILKSLQNQVDDSSEDLPPNSNRDKTEKPPSTDESLQSPRHPQEKPMNAANPKELPSNPESETWSINGTIKSPNGDPLPGVKVWASTGIGSLRRTGEAVTDDNGKYEFTFTPGMLFFTPNDSTKPGADVQAATIFASLDGHSEANLCRQGDRLMADVMPTEDTAWGTVDQIRDKLILKGQPVTIDFVMKPAASIEGFLVDQDGHLLQRCSLSITGPELPPSSSVYEQVHTDLDGRFEFATVPVDKQWQWEFGIATQRRCGNR